VPVFTLWNGASVGYIVTPVALLRHLGLAHLLKEYYQTQSLVRLRMCRSHSRQFFHLLWQAVVNKHGVKALYFFMKYLSL
jgi:hypothetical protein